jgi:hypothetical protein
MLTVMHDVHLLPPGDDGLADGHENLNAIISKQQTARYSW